MIKSIYIWKRAKLVVKEGNIITLFKKVFKRYIASYVNYYIYKTMYPQNIIFIAGYAKAGTTWMVNMLNEIKGFDAFTPLKWPYGNTPKSEMDLYPGIFREYKNKLAIIKGHTWGDEENLKILKNEYRGKFIVMVRDPRDALISAYWYIKKRPKHWDYKNVKERTVNEYIGYKLESGEFNSQYLDWLRSWIQYKDNHNFIIVRYEDLLKNTFNEMKKLFDYLDFNIRDEKIEELVKKHEFKRETGRERGKEDTSSFKRKAISGEYINVFTSVQNKIAVTQAKDVLMALGYNFN